MAVQKLQTRPPRFVVGYDFTDTAEQAIEQAVAYASLIPDTTIHVGWAPPVGAPLPTGSENNLPAEPMDALKEQMGRMLRRYAEAGIQLPNAQMELHILAGSADDALARLAFSVEADLVIVGTKGRKGLERMVVGSVAESVVRKAPCPVLVARPKSVEALPEVEPPPAENQDTLSHRPHTYRGKGRDIQPHESFPLTVPQGFR